MSSKMLSIILSLLLLAALVVAYTLLPNKNPSQKDDTLAQRTHSAFYRDAKNQWDAKFETSPLSSSMIRITWEKPTQTYNHFLITITDPLSEWTRTESGEHDRVSLDVSDLQPDTKYIFVLRACVDPKCSTWYVSHQEPVARTTSNE